MSRLTMMPPSQPATSSPPKRGTTATTRPATTSTTPTMCMAVAASPGMMSLNAGARYRVQSSVSTFANLSRPNRIGATVNAIRSSRVACATGSLRSAVEAGTEVGRRAAVALVMRGSSLEGEVWLLGLATPTGPVLPRIFRGQRAQALVLVTAGRAALEVRRHARHAGVGGRPAQLQLDVRVELLEALVAAQLRCRRAEHAREDLVRGELVHRSSSQLASIGKPRSASAARSRRRASCRVL